MTPAMAGIKQWLEDKGYGPVAHHHDSEICNETLEFRLNGYRVEIELGGSGCTAGAKDGFVALCYQAGGEKFELADPEMFDKLHRHLQTCYPAVERVREKKSRVTPDNPFGFVDLATLLADERGITDGEATQRPIPDHDPQAAQQPAPAADVPDQGRPAGVLPGDPVHGPPLPGAAAIHAHPGPRLPPQRGREDRQRQRHLRRS